MVAGDFILRNGRRWRDGNLVDALYDMGPGDVVSYQLPNRVEALIAFYGTAMLGAVLVPIVHFYGPKEVRFILEESAANVHVTAASFRGTDFVEALAPFWRDLPGLEKLIVIDGEPPDGALAYGDLLRTAPLEGCQGLSMAFV